LPDERRLLGLATLDLDADASDEKIDAAARGKAGFGLKGHTGCLERLRHGAYWLRLLDTSILPDTPMPELFIVTLRALAHLNYGELPPELVTLAFEAHLTRLSGLSPRMDVCALCGRPVDGDSRFDAELGGSVCLNCPSAAPRVSNGARRILMKLPRTQFDKFQLLADRPEWPEAARLMRSFVNLKLHADRYSPPLLDEQPPCAPEEP